MSLRQSISKKAKDWKKAVQDKKNQEKVKREVLLRFKEAKAELSDLGRRIASEKNRKKMKEHANAVKAKYRALKKRFMSEEKKAAAVVRHNPHKALAIASAVGNLAGTLWASVSPPRRAKASKRRK
jgi:ElaB/YqjD/DUF883 family membrane-anchored ribosome-binding protein